MIADFCSSAEPSHNNEIRAHVLSLLGKDDLDVVFEQIELPLVHNYKHYLILF